MSALDSLKEDILDVFRIFDEDGSGSITFQEFARALHTITGVRMSRSDLRVLVRSAQEDLQEEANSKRAKAHSRENSPTPYSSFKQAMTKTVENNDADAVDATLFLAVVLMTLHKRTPEQERVVTFHLLEDKNYPGFITKESLMKAAADMEERLTEHGVDEMFDKIVTGQPSAAVDFATFTNILESARKMED